MAEGTPQAEAVPGVALGLGDPVQGGLGVEEVAVAQASQEEVQK